MSPPVELTTEALRELRDATNWYETRRDGLGLVFIAAVDRVIERISRWPQAGSPLDDVEVGLTVRTARVDRFPYLLAYVVQDDAVTVVALVHDRRRPRYWIERVGK